MTLTNHDRAVPAPAARDQAGAPPGPAQRIVELERRLADLQSRLPAHSVPPAMVMEIEELEDELARLQRDLVKRAD